MAIQYPVQAGSLWSILQVSTGQIVGRNRTWPVADGGPIQGQDPDYVYLLQVSTAEPDYDSRLYQIAASEVVDADANEIRRSWAAEKLPVEDRVSAAENTEAQEFTRHVNLAREAIETRLMVTALINYTKGLTLPPKVRAMADAYAEKGVRLYRNRDRLQAILADIQAGKDPDIDAGWEPADD